jgi:DNA-binding GntR family transcriptional regulator
MAEQTPAFKNIKTPPSLKEIAYQAIKDSIISLKLKPSAVYSEQAIARELGISKTPVHQALTDLENRKFVTLLPRKGFVVNELTEKEIRNLFEYRYVLERAVICHITPQLTDESIQKIDIINRKAADSIDRLGFQKYDRAFHRYLSSLTDNQFIIDALENIWDLCSWIGAQNLSIKDRGNEAVKEHKSIAKMLKKRDLAGALNAMKEHLRITEKKFINEVIKSKSHDHRPSRWLDYAL